MFRLKASSNMAAAALLVLVICVVIVLLSNRHYARRDLTATREHTLSDKTLQVLSTIREPVQVKAFVQEGQDGARIVKRLLDSYRDHSRQITFELIDPDRQPAEANRYQVKNLNTLILEGYGATQTVKIPDEGAITNALIRLSRRDTLKAYFLSGHGERALKGPDPESFSALHSALGKENIEFHELNLMNTEMPADAALVVIAAPLKPLFKEEIQPLSEYLAKGGSLVIFLEPFVNSGLEPFLKENGIRVSHDIVVDKMSRIMGGDYLMPMLANYGRHGITKEFRLPCFFPTARSVEASQENTGGSELRVTPLALTSANSWAETDQETLNQGKAGFDGKDRAGPISLAVISEKTVSAGAPDKTAGEKRSQDDPEQKGKLVVFGDADFASDKFLNLSGNAEFVFNTINYLTGRQDLITIEKDGEWFLQGEDFFKTDRESVESLIRATISAYPVSFEEEKVPDLSPYGLARPKARIALSDGNKTEEIAYGDPVKQGKGELIYAAMTGKPQVVAVRKQLLEDLPKSKEDLKSKPPEE